MARNWGVPDWTDERAYRHYARLPADALRWEFLRRHPTYRKAWIAHNEGAAATAVEPDWQREFGIERLWDPASENAPLFLASEVLFVPYGADDDPEIFARSVDFALRAGRSGYVLAIIDPSVPIDENLKAIKGAYLEQLADWDIKIVKTKDQSGDAPRFLRILDGRNAGVTLKNIGLQFDEENRKSGQEDFSAQGIVNRQKRAWALAEKLTGVPWPESDRSKRGPSEV